MIDGWYHKKAPNMIRKYPNPVSYPYVDVPAIINLQVRVCNSKELNRISWGVRELIISSNSCNELNSLNLNEYQYLKSIEIGNDCFENVDLFKIDRLNELKSLKIGNNSFTKKKNWYGNNPNRSFSILNCDKLESIEIGPFSFSDYGGGFELANLPKLELIKIGEIGNRSSNFCYSSFVIKGIINVIYC